MRTALFAQNGVVRAHEFRDSLDILAAKVQQVWKCYAFAVR